MIIQVDFDFSLSDILICLGVDVAFYLLSRSSMRRKLEQLETLRSAPRFDNEPDLRANLLLGSNNDDALTGERSSILYAVVEGRVEPMVGTGICSQAAAAHLRSVDRYGVVKSLVVTDHRLEHRDGEWRDKHVVKKNTYEQIPFKIALAGGGEGVEFRDVDKLDSSLRCQLEVTSDEFQPLSADLVETLRNNSRREVSTGIQTKEKMLRVGTTVTAIGKIVMMGGTGNRIRMVCPSEHYDYVFTRKSCGELLRG